MTAPTSMPASARSSEPESPPKRHALDHFYATFFDPDGNPIDTPEICSVLKITIEEIHLIRESQDFIEQLRGIDMDYSARFIIDCEFDAYPILIFWEPSSNGYNCANFLSNGTGPNGLPVEAPPCTLLLCDDNRFPDEHISNIFSGLWDIENIEEVLARYRERPLALLVSAVPPGDPLSAAALTFAGVHYLLAPTGRSAFTGD